MNRGIPARKLWLMLFFLACTQLVAETWYVRPDGGTRYSTDVATGQCDGKSDTAYPGKGTHRHCAFKDVQYLWQDGSKYSYFHRGWIIAGGDTVILRGSIADKVSYRIGWPESTGPCAGGFPCFGFPEGAADSGSPYNNFPSGSPGHPTRLLGGNYGNCSAQSARTQLHGGFGVYSVLDFRKASYIDVECLDITDFSGCGRVGQNPSCGKTDDSASFGFRLNNEVNHARFADIRIHGMAVAGMVGAVGDDVTFTDWAVIGNAGAGWNADDGTGTTGSGNLLVQDFEISWNGCAEEYPLVDSLPYNGCTDDNSLSRGGSGVAGYGDGFGTTTKTGSVAWHIRFEHGVVSYNTQDGLDALHASGAGSTTTADRVLAYGNMGNQIKIGSDGGSTITNNIIYNNCDAMSGNIPGTPSGYNKLLSDFCRADDEAIIVSMNDGSTSTVAGNTIYGARAGTAINSWGDLGGIVCAGTCTTKDKLIYADNILVGFDPNKTGRLPEQYYLQEHVFSSNPFTNSGSIYSHNLQYHVSTSCPDRGEADATCRAPQLSDITWHRYGYSNVRPSSSSNVVGAGINLPAVTHDYAGDNRGNPPSIGAYEPEQRKLSGNTVQQEPTPAQQPLQSTSRGRSADPVWACCGVGTAAVFLLIYRGKKKK
jgi:hypothetical protein